MQNPVTSNIKIIGAYFSIWAVIALIQASALYYLLNIEPLYAAADALVFNLLFSLNGLSLWFPAQFLSLESNKLPKIVFNHLAAALVTSVIWITVSSFILSKIFPDAEGYMNFLQLSFIWRLILGVVYYAIITAIYYLVIYYKNFQEKKIRQIELERLVNEAELKSLKYQINPHFIFNSLNSISSLTLTNPGLARDMTIKLASFLRRILSKNDKAFNPLVDEIDLVKLYLDIEKIRFEDKFNLIIENKNNCENIKVPNMLLQPLAENAIKFGVYEATEKIEIKIKCIKHNDVLEIRFINEYDPESIPRKGEGIGLKNIAERLKLIYGRLDLLQIEKLNNKFIVKIYIPLQEKQ